MKLRSGSGSGQGLRLSFNAPATLVFVALCVAARLIDMLTGGAANRVIFSVYRASLANPLTYVRCMMYILILGPMIEEKYGTSNTVIIIAATAVVTGIINMVFFPGVMMLGASGVVFAFILISSITVREDRTIPVTFILVALLYLGQQVYEGIFVRDNVSQMAHIAGGAVGSVLGFLMSKKKKRDHF